MGSVYPKRRANGSRVYVAQVTLPSKERIQQTFSSRNEAQLWIAEIESSFEAKSPVVSAGSTTSRFGLPGESRPSAGGSG